MLPNTKEGLKQDAKNATRNLDQNSQEIVREAHADITDIANRAGRKVRSLYASASNEISDDYEYVATRIRSNPVQASVIALGAGFLLGALLRRL